MKTSQDKFDLLQRFIRWREKHITNKQFILILSFLVGIFTALAAYVLKFLVEYIKEFLTENFDPMGANLALSGISGSGYFYNQFVYP